MLKEYLAARKLNIALAVASIALMCAAWIIAYIAVGNDYVLPSFADTLSAFGSCFKSGEFWAAFGYTFLRTVISFLASFILAATFAALSSVSKIFKGIVQPVMSFIRTLPTLAVALLLLIWTTPTAAPVIITVLVLFPMIYSQLTAALNDIDPDLKQMAAVYELKKRQTLFKIYLPPVSANALEQAGANVSLGLKIMVSAEVICSTAHSLGGMMQTSRAFLEMPKLAALTLVAVLLGFVFEIAFSQLKRINSKWRKGAENAHS